jgi:hypothetical protein
MFATIFIITLKPDFFDKNGRDGGAYLIQLQRMHRTCRPNNRIHPVNPVHPVLRLLWGAKITGLNVVAASASEWTLFDPPAFRS